MRRNDVASTSFRRHVPTRFLINQCQIITFLILKYDIIENSRIELRGIVLPVQVGGLLGGRGGGGQRVCWPPSQIIGGGGWPPCPPPPSSYAYDYSRTLQYLHLYASTTLHRYRCTKYRYSCWSIFQYRCNCTFTSIPLNACNFAIIVPLDSRILSGEVKQLNN